MDRGSSPLNNPLLDLREMEAVEEQIEDEEEDEAVEEVEGREDISPEEEDGEDEEEEEGISSTTPDCAQSKSTQQNSQDQKQEREDLCYEEFEEGHHEQVREEDGLNISTELVGSSSQASHHTEEEEGLNSTADDEDFNSSFETSSPAKSSVLDLSFRAEEDDGQREEVLNEIDPKQHQYNNDLVISEMNKPGEKILSEVDHSAAEPHMEANGEQNPDPDTGPTIKVSELPSYSNSRPNPKTASSVPYIPPVSKGHNRPEGCGRSLTIVPIHTPRTQNNLPSSSLCNTLSTAPSVQPNEPPSTLRSPMQPPGTSSARDTGNQNARDSTTPSIRNNRLQTAQDKKIPVAQDTKTPSARDTRTPSTEDTSTPSTRDTRTPSNRDTRTPSNRDTRTPSNRNTRTPITRDTRTPVSDQERCRSLPPPRPLSPGTVSGSIFSHHPTAVRLTPQGGIVCTPLKRLLRDPREVQGEAAGDRAPVEDFGIVQDGARGGLEIGSREFRGHTREVRGPPKKIKGLTQEVGGLAQDVRVQPEEVRGLSRDVRVPSQTCVGPPQEVERRPQAQEVRGMPQELTSPPQELMSPPQELTSPPQELTSPPQELTSPPQELTSPPQELTSPPQELTSPSQELTSLSQELTTPPQELASQPQELKGLPQELRSPPQELTSPPQKLTRSPQELRGQPQEVRGLSQEKDGPPQEIRGPPQGESAQNILKGLTTSGEGEEERGEEEGEVPNNSLNENRKRVMFDESTEKGEPSKRARQPNLSNDVSIDEADGGGELFDDHDDTNSGEIVMNLDQVSGGQKMKFNIPGISQVS